MSFLCPRSRKTALFWPVNVIITNIGLNYLTQCLCLTCQSSDLSAETIWATQTSAFLVVVGLLGCVVVLLHSELRSIILSAGSIRCWVLDKHLVELKYLMLSSRCLALLVRQHQQQCWVCVIYSCGRRAVWCTELWSLFYATYAVFSPVQSKCTSWHISCDPKLTATLTAP